MDKSFDMESFGSVWRRVARSAENTQPPDAADIIGNLIDMEYSGTVYYKAMARSTRSRWAKDMFARLYYMEYAHMQRLQTEYFILTGDTKRTSRGNIAISSLLAALRQRYSAEREEMDAYKKASLKIPDKRLAGIMEEMSAEEAGHIRIIFGMIEKLIR